MIGVLYSCSNSSDMEETIVVSQMDSDASEISETNYSMGDFISGAHSTSGSVFINLNKTILSFKNFKTDNGPKLLVYVSTDVDTSEYVDLGDLKWAEGNFTYAIAESADVVKYNIVNI